MENLDLLPVLLQPLFDVFAMMNRKIIQNQKDLTTGILCQSGHKLDQELGIHGIPEHHETHLATVRDGRYHTNMALFGHHPDYRGLSLRGKAPDSVGARLNPRLIAPVNLSFFLFRPGENDRIIPLQPFLYRLRTLLVSALDRLLRSKSPTLEILPHCPDRHLNAKSLFDQQLYRLSRPQGKGKLQLVRCLVNQVSLYLGFLFRRKGAFLPLLATTYPQLDGLATPLQVALPNSAGVVNADSDTFCQNLVRNPLFSETDNLFSDLMLRLRTKSLSVNNIGTPDFSPADNGER